MPGRLRCEQRSRRLQAKRRVVDCARGRKGIDFVVDGGDDVYQAVAGGDGCEDVFDGNDSCCVTARSARSDACCSRSTPAARARRRQGVCCLLGAAAVPRRGRVPSRGTARRHALLMLSSLEFSALAARFIRICAVRPSGGPGDICKRCGGILVEFSPLGTRIQLVLASREGG